MEFGRSVFRSELSNGIVVSTIYLDGSGYETVAFDKDGKTIGVAIRGFDYVDSSAIHDEMVEKYDR